MISPFKALELTSLFVVAILSTVCCEWPDPRRPFVFPGSLAKGSPQESANYSYETRYFKQHVDHFGFANGDKYDQRYLFSDEHWNKTGGPIFLYAGNEARIEAFAENTGFMWDIAPLFNAMIVFAEHRYYGKSMPYGSDSFKNSSTLNFLTSEQALADFAELVVHLKQSIPGAANSKVIVFGGSYGGMLAAWMRMKYPNIVQGALASSAPIWQFTGLTPCNAFNDVVTKVFRSVSEICVDNVHRSYQTFRDIASQPGGPQFIATAFKLDAPMNHTQLEIFLTSFEEIFGALAMVNYPYPANLLGPLPGYPVKVACGFLSQRLEGKALITAMSQVFGMYANSSEESSVDPNQDSNSTSSHTIHGWTYQTCTEMVMPFCSNYSGLFVNSTWDFQRNIDNCYATFNVRPRENWIRLQYWGRQLETASNIIFSNGQDDPWSSGGVLKSVSDNVVAFIIKEAAHHYDLRGKNDMDTPYVKAARLREISIIKSWLSKSA